MTNELLVVRDRSLVRAAIDQNRCANIVSASQFFEKIRMLSFMFHADIKRVDQLPLMIAQDLLQSAQKYPISYAENLVSLYNSIFHGLSSPSEIVRELQSQENIDQDLLFIMQKCHEIEVAMEQENAINGVMALKRAHDILQEKKIIPPQLVKTQKIIFENLVDLTNLEIAVIKALAALDFPIEVRLPLDFEKRGINVAVDYMAKLFEKSEGGKNLELKFFKLGEESRLSSLVNGLFLDQKISYAADQVEVIEEKNALNEAQKVAQKILSLKQKNPRDTMALVVRQSDKRALFYRECLKRYDIKVKDRKGRSLFESAAGELLSLIFRSLRHKLPKDSLKALLCHRNFSLKLSDEDFVIASLILERADACKNNLDDNIVQVCTNQREKIKESFLKTPKLHEKFDEVFEKCHRIVALFQTSENDETFAHHLNFLSDLIENYFSFEKDDVAFLTLQKEFEKLESAADFSRAKISAHHFIGQVTKVLKKVSVPYPDHFDEHAVEFLMLPEIMGRKFDHIFMVDMAFGRLPQSPSQDPLFPDNMRVLLNRLMKKNILRIFFDDPFEPLLVPPRQALEPFWFATCVASAKKSLTFSVAHHDQSGQEQNPSEFFVWLKNHLQIGSSDQAQEFTSAAEREFDRGETIYKNNLSHEILAINQQRKNIFSKGEIFSHGFQFESEKLIEHFDGRLGKNITKSLTPTFIESFARCPYKAALEKFFPLEKNNFRKNSQALHIGKISHKILENYFRKKIVSQNYFLIESEVKIIFAEVIKKFFQNNFVDNEEFFICQNQWLISALSKLIFQLQKQFPLDRSQKSFTELSIGIEKSFYAPVKICGEEKNYLLGGIIDRIEKFGEHYLIIDYKLSSANNLRVSLNEKNLLKNHFQMPIYLLLWGKAMSAEQNISFCFASIRDAAVMPEFSAQKHEALFEKIFHDDSEDSLAKAIEKIFLPIEKGALLAKENEYCSSCDFSYVCRKAEDLA